MSSVSPELKAQFLKHLGNRPNEFRYSSRDRYKKRYNIWRDKLEDFKVRLFEGQSTGDIVTDYALMSYHSKADVLAAETYLHNLQNRIRVAADQEILVQRKGTGSSGCSDYGGQSTPYHYNIYELAHIQDGSITNTVDRTLPLIPMMFLHIVTGGYSRCDDDFGLSRSGPQFISKNLSLPKEEDCVAIGTKEVAAWRDQNIYNESRYQMLTQTLSQGLAQKTSI